MPEPTNPRRHVRLAASILAAAVFASAIVTMAGHSPRAGAATASGYYLSLGDSLAVGYQPGTADESETLHGYSNRVVTDLAGDVNLTLENYGCMGETTSTILVNDGCGLEANDGILYPDQTQIAAAISFIDDHPGQISLITISIGSNDYGNCQVGFANPAACVAGVMPTMKANIETIASELRAATGPSTPIFGITDFVDPLSYWLDGPSGRAVAKDWLAEYRDVIVPTLSQAFEPSGSIVVNMTAPSGAYQPLTKTVNDPPYGRIPLAVARVCQLVWICRVTDDDGHPTNAGYALMARQIAAAYRRLHP